jgi:hypothetical protein
MCRVCFFVFVTVLFIAVSPGHAFEASCDLRKCMDICRNEYESGCAGMCGRIISLCRQLVQKPERTRSARHSVIPRGNIEPDAQARSSQDLID